MARIAAAAAVGPDFRVDALEPGFLRSSDRISQVTLLAARATMKKHAGQPDPAGIGVVFGLDYGVYPTVAACLHRTATEGYRSASPQEFALATPNIAHSLTCIRMGLKGPNTCLCCGSLSSLAAIGLASDLIDWGRASTLLAGGATVTDGPMSRLAAAFGVRDLTERAAFVLLERDAPGIVVRGFTQRRLRNGAMGLLIREAIGGRRIDSAILHPGPSEDMDGLPDVPRQDIRELAGGETLDASGAVAVVEAARRVERGSPGVLVAFRDLGGHDGAALTVVREA